MTAVDRAFTNWNSRSMTCQYAMINLKVHRMTWFNCDPRRIAKSGAVLPNTSIILGVSKHQAINLVPNGHNPNDLSWSPTCPLHYHEESASYTMHAWAHTQQVVTLVAVLSSKLMAIRYRSGSVHVGAKNIQKYQSLLECKLLPNVAWNVNTQRWIVVKHLDKWGQNLKIRYID